MYLSRGTKIAVRIAAALVMCFVYLPLLIIAIYAFNEDRTQQWPLPGVSLEWFGKALHNPGVRDALWTSLQAGLGATAIALVLAPFGVELGLFTVIVGHATFCVVVLYNNAVARMRRTSRSFEEASADLGADTWQTFRFVTMPQLRGALVAGALLAFGLSFDEIIVTTFTAGSSQTLPIWILTNLSRPNQLPIVNVVAVFVVVISIIPVYLAHRLTTERDEHGEAEPAAEALAVP